ncbi:hypothetical protein LLG38_08750 [bacterium]|nr:hypothetical protein [bacterium]
MTTFNNMNMEFWKRLKSLRTALLSDPALEARFRDNPVSVLKESGLDIPMQLKAGDSPVSLVTLVEKMRPEEQKATIDAVFDTVLPKDVHPQAPVPIVVANANGVANANADANADAGANANANTNTNANGEVTGDGFAGMDQRFITTITLPDDFDTTEIAERFRAIQLNSDRQKALLKKAFSDPSSLVSSQEIDGTEKVCVVEYEFRGVKFRAEAILRGQEIKVMKCRISE